jgi:hypothetical protein
LIGRKSLCLWGGIAKCSPLSVNPNRGKGSIYEIYENWQQIFNLEVNELDEENDVAAPQNRLSNPASIQHMMFT